MGLPLSFLCLLVSLKACYEYALSLQFKTHVHLLEPTEECCNGPKDGGGEVIADEV